MTWREIWLEFDSVRSEEVEADTSMEEQWRTSRWDGDEGCLRALANEMQARNLANSRHCNRNLRIVRGEKSTCRPWTTIISRVVLRSLALQGNKP